MRKAERHSELRRRAEELARTGQFSSWQTIEIELNDDEARAALDGHAFRDRLDKLCAFAQGDRKDA